MLKLFKNLKKTEWGLAALSFVFIIAQVWLDLTMPEYMAEITMLVQTEGSKMSEIFSAGGMMLLCALGSLVASMVTAVCAAKIATNFGGVLRRKLFKKVQSFSMEEIGRFSTASLITRSTNDITQVQMLIVMGLQMLVKAPVTAVWAIYKISGKAAEWTITTAIAVLVLLIVVLLCLFLTLPKFKKMQVLTDDVNRVTRENLTGLRVVRAYNAEKYQENKFENANNALTTTSLFTQRTMSFMMPSIQLIMSGLSLAIYWVGAVLIDQAGMADKITLFSDMMVFSQYAIQVVMAFMMLVMIFMILPRASVSAKRICEVLDTELTIIDLIPRFYDATEGQVLVDGVDVKNYTQKALRNKIGYVSQKATLFTGSIRSNVAYGDNGTVSPDTDAIKTAVATAQASDFVENMEDTYDGYVAQDGANLSGGQKQRISIARAMIADKPMLILDEATSSVDTRTEQQIQAAMDKLMENRTSFVIAHRLSTIKNSDLILVMKDGDIIESGNHEELLAKGGFYSDLYNSQFEQAS